jgi:hypothetical protein
MSRITPHVRRLIGLCLLAAAFGLVEVVAIAAAAEGQGKELEPPTLLWKSYPLEQRPSTTDQGGTQIRKQPVPAQSSAQDDFPTPALLGGLTLLLAAAAIMRKRRSIPILRGKTRRTPDRAPMLRPAQPASVEGPLWRRPQQLREVIPEVVEEPRARAPQPPEPQSPAALLEALQLKSPRTPEPEPRPQITERETEADRSLERQLELELWTRIADVKLVPIPGPNPQTHEELPPP